MRSRIVRSMRTTALGAALTLVTLAAITPASAAARVADHPGSGHEAAAPIPPRLPVPAVPATAYVVNNGSKTVTPVNTATNVAGKPIAAGTFPVTIAVTP